MDTKSSIPTSIMALVDIMECAANMVVAANAGRADAAGAISADAAANLGALVVVAGWANAADSADVC